MWLEASKIDFINRELIQVSSPTPDQKTKLLSPLPFFAFLLTPARTRIRVSTFLGFREHWTRPVSGPGGLRPAAILCSFNFDIWCFFEEGEGFLMEGKRISASPRPCNGRRILARKRPRSEGVVNSVKKLMRREISSKRDRSFSMSNAQERFRNIQLQVEFFSLILLGYVANTLLFCNFVWLFCWSGWGKLM